MIPMSKSERSCTSVLQRQGPHSDAFGHEAFSSDNDDAKVSPLAEPLERGLHDPQVLDCAVAARPANHRLSA